MFAMVETRAHDDHVLFGGVGVAQDVAQVVKVPRIANRNQNVPWTDAHGAAAQFLIAIDAELVELLRLAVALLGNVALR